MHGGHTFITLVSSLEAPHPNTLTTGVRISTYEFQEDTNTQTIAEM